MNPPSARIRVTPFSLLLLLRTTTLGYSGRGPSSAPAFVNAPAAYRLPTKHRSSSVTARSEAIQEDTMPAAENPKVGFIGAGMMASAMINGIIAAKVLHGTHVS